MVAGRTATRSGARQAWLARTHCDCVRCRPAPAARAPRVRSARHPGSTRLPEPALAPAPHGERHSGKGGGALGFRAPG
eukprot:8333536-Lingulodinium_polyedra.AAC.1